MWSSIGNALLWLVLAGAPWVFLMHSGHANGKKDEKGQAPYKDLYNLCTFLKPPLGGWLSVSDCLGRAIRIIYVFYYLLFARPYELYSFLVKYHGMFHFGSHSAYLVGPCFIAWPLMVFFHSLWERLSKLFKHRKRNVFFTEPANLISRLAFAFVMNAQVPLTIFMVHGSNPEALRGAWHDYICTKPFWRKHLEAVGGRVPLSLGTWNGSECQWESRATGQGDDYQLGDVVMKLPDGCLGGGDQFLEVGAAGYDGSICAAQNILKEKFPGISGVLVLEWIRPAKSCEVHSFDICTVVRPDGTVEVASCLYWGACLNGSSTHDATVGFVCDVSKETIMAPACWYSACFAKPGAFDVAGKGKVPAVGSAIPGLREMCLTAVCAHTSVLSEQPWLRMVGWDAMFTDTGPVFFEGNYASHRMPRRVFLSWELTKMFLQWSGTYPKIPNASQESASATTAVITPASALNGSSPLPLATPESVGISSERLSQISRWSDGWVSSLKLPGLITAVARHGQLCYMHASGWADVEQQTCLGSRTIMRIFSMTKPIVSVAAMRLYEHGLFQLDEPISRYLPSFARPKVLTENGEAELASREVTFIDLLTHTSGIGYNDDDDEDSAMSKAYEDAGIADPDSMTLAEFVDKLGTLPLHFEPGTSWRYGYSTDVLGRLLEILTSLPLDEVLEQEIFSRLGMNDTGFCVPKEKQYRFAAVYKVDNDEDQKSKETMAERQRFERFDSCVSVVRVNNIGNNVPEHSGVSIAVISCASTANIKAPSAATELAVLAGKPVIEHVLTQLYVSGVARIVLVIAGQAHLREVVEALPLVSQRQVHVEFVDLGEDYSEGWAKSLTSAESAVGSSNFLLCTSDRIFDADIIRKLATSPLASAHKQRGFRAVALVEDVTTGVDALPRETVRVQLTEQADGVKRISAIGNHEGIRTDAIEAGIYICSPCIFKVMQCMEEESFKLSDCMQCLAQKGHLGCMSTEGKLWFRCKPCQRSHNQHGGRFRHRRVGGPLMWEMSLGTDHDRVDTPIIKSAIAVAKSATCFFPCDESYCGSFTSRPLHFSGGSGLVSTLHDYCLFCQMLLNGGELNGVRILSRKTVEYMRNNFLPLNHTGKRQDIAAVAYDSGFSETSFDGIGFGIGWSVMTDPVKASILTSRHEHGWGGWASTFFSLDPVEDMFVISLAQLIPSDRYPIRRQLRCLLSQTLIA